MREIKGGAKMYKKEETKSKKNCKDQLLNINSFFKKIKKFLR